jgi:hypothetical protein
LAVFKNYKNSPNFRVIFFTLKVMRFILSAKMGWVEFWSFFSQTHLVTLAVAQDSSIDLDT